MTFALIKRGICVNTIDADQKFIDEVTSKVGYDVIVDCSGMDIYGPGMFWDGTRFWNIEEAMSKGIL